MLLVISSNKQSGDVVSTLAIWDFADGHRDVFCKSVLPMRVRAAAWNPYCIYRTAQPLGTADNADEFVTIGDRVYHYWRISKDLEL